MNIFSLVAIFGTCLQLPAIASGAGIDCGQLPAIANGAVEISPDTRLGSIATYSCNNDYILMGEATRTCQANGQYSGGEPRCRPVDCGHLPHPNNGWVHVSPDTLLGAMALYRCKLGYEITTDYDGRTCGSDEQWNPSPAPSCAPIA